MNFTFRTAFLLCALCALCVQIGCSTPRASGAADPAQVAKLSAVAGATVQLGVAAILQQNPGSRAELLAVAEAIEQAAALPDAPPPSNLVNLASSAAAKFGGGYGALAGLGLQAGFAIYQNFYAANATSALDKKPAAKAILLALASGIRSAASGAPAATLPPEPLTESDYQLRPAR